MDVVQKMVAEYGQYGLPVAALGSVIVLIIIGIIFKRLLIRGPKGNTILLLGLCNSGKTSLFTLLRDGELKETHTSMKENDETFLINEKIQKESPRKEIHVVDIPGHQRVRNLLKDFLPLARKIVFLIDSTEFEVRQNAEYLYEILSNKNTIKNKIAVCIVCNKSDIITARSKNAICAELEKEIEKIRQTRKSVPDQLDEAENVILGIEGEPFKFEHLNNKISTADASVLEGKIQPIVDFIVQ